jgi:hypothetical protein
LIDQPIIKAYYKKLKESKENAINPSYECIENKRRKFREEEEWYFEYI